MNWAYFRNALMLLKNGYLKILRDPMECSAFWLIRFALMAPMSYISNLALRINTFPNVWKQSRITPVHEKGNVIDLSISRPISILPSFAKIFEATVFNHCTITNLEYFSHCIGQALDKRFEVVQSRRSHLPTKKKSILWDSMSILCPFVLI